MSNKLLHAALEYAGRGWYVIPQHSPRNGKCSCGHADCKHPGKHPRTENGSSDASIDPQQIKKWWQQWPDANIAIVPKPSGLVAIDVDPRSGGDKTWEHISHGSPVDTPIVQSGGVDGGRHYYFTDTRPVDTQLGAGLEVKYRACITAPPSLHVSGKEYQWITPPNGHVQEVPSWLKPYAIIIEQTDPAKRAAETIINRWLDRAQNAPEGVRNRTLYTAAFTIGGILHLGLSEGEAERMLVEAGLSCGLMEREALSAIRSGLKRGSAKPIALDAAEGPFFEAPDMELPQAGLDPWGEPLTMQDAYQSIEPLVYVVEGLITAESLTILYGDSGAMKSLLLADLAVCVSGGFKFLDQFCTLQGPVMWLDWDNGKRRTNNRFGAFGRARGLPADAPLYYYSMPSPTLDGANQSHVAALYARIMSHGVRLVIIDNLGLVAGSADENSREMAQVIKGFRWLSETTGAAFIIIHHQSKDSTGFKKKAGDKLRGHSSIKAGVDVALYVTRDMDGEIPSPEVNVFAPKQRDFDVKPFGARFEHTSRQVGLLETARFVSIDFLSEQTIQKNRRNTELENKILDALGSQTMSVNAIKNKLGCRAETIHPIVDDMVSRGVIVTTPGTRGMEYRQC
jgi:hypothetical protein